MKFKIVIIPFVVFFLFFSGISYSKSNDSGKVFIKHRVVAGDTLYLLSAYYMNNPRKWKKIYNINKGKITNPNVLTVGAVLKIPVEKKNFKPRFSIRKWRQDNKSK